MQRASWKTVLFAVALCACGGKESASSDPGSTTAVEVPPGAPELVFEGRFDGASRFGWPGSSIWLRFSGTGARVVLAEQSLENDKYGKVAHNEYDVTVDGQLTQTVKAAEGTNTYTLASGLAPGEHQIVLRKRTESYVGLAQLVRFELDAGARLLPASGAARRLEFVGDSITTGYGVDGADASCMFSAETQNYSHSYAALTAQALSARQVAIAATGVGVSRNFNGSTTNTAADLYQRTVATDWTTHWDFSRYQPDAVIFNLGTDDFLSPGGIDEASFLSAYAALLAQTRRNYPNALLVVAIGPMLSDLYPVGANALTNARAWMTQLVADANAAGDARVKLLEFPNQDHAATVGCDSHPSVETHQAMAAQLTAFLKQELHW